MINAVLFKSENRFQSFKKKLLAYGVNCTVLDFQDQEWVTYDYSNIDVLIYFPTFKFSSNHPLALSEAHDNLMYIHQKYPNIKMFPDPNIIKYYNDKYRQLLFLKGHNFPVPETIPLFSEEAVELAVQRLGYPIVLKNRYGAGGDSVFMIHNKKELYQYYKLSKLNFYHFDAIKYFLKMFTRRDFYYYLIRERQIEFPLFSSPLLAQKFIKLDRDLKIVVGDYSVVEGHWRIQADESMWKVNIDGGGIGEWSRIPQDAIDLTLKLAEKLGSRWLNIDLILSEGKFVISEFSPVWHHYRYKEKTSFVYKDDYNVDLPLEISLDLERIIIESLIKAAAHEKKVPIFIKE